ncbi:hypothetical protein SAMN05421749_101597 [Acinetobacter marinus]|uniref:Lipoprotein n=1 Tax=Acinetobacter marinus TaxID=281375 RepID=A0A1G6GZI4_9GAMM|nr:hypothetical protein [Acinetobacter marinus]SDB87419.1 hypothetical protein SAMN05421749_101597 [Acinetobacter marinus]
MKTIHLILLAVLATSLSACLYDVKREHRAFSGDAKYTTTFSSTDNQKVEQRI